MERVCYIEQCYQCRYCYFNGEYAHDKEGYCDYFDGDSIFIEDVFKSIPEWCELEIKK